jgi:hypothetical protein
LTLLTKAKPKSKDKGTPKKRAVSALRGVGAVTTSAADLLITAKQKRLSMPPTNDGASVVKLVSRFKQLERDLDTLPLTDVHTQKLREEHADIKGRLVAKGYAAKLVALKEWKEGGSDPNKHPWQTPEEQHALLKKLKEIKDKEEKDEEEKLLKEPQDKEEQDLHDLMIDKELITAFEESVGNCSAG